jgi:hypothetical protein
MGAPLLDVVGVPIMRGNDITASTATMREELPIQGQAIAA